MSETPIFDRLYCETVVRHLFADLADEWGADE